MFDLQERIEQLETDLASSKEKYHYLMKQFKMVCSKCEQLEAEKADLEETNRVLVERSKDV